MSDDMLEGVKKTAAYWPLLSLFQRVEQLEKKVAELEEKKANKRGPKSKG